jgi:RNA polymerase sigma-70 factor (ECF subfamily)
MSGSECKRLFDELYREHMVGVWTYALYLARDRAEAEDLFQDAWLRVAEKMDDIDRTGNLKAWLMTIVVNLHRDKLRRLRVRRPFLAGRSRPDLVKDEKGASGLGQDAALEWEKAETGRAVHAAVSRLPERLRSVFVLREIEGYPYADIGRILNLRIGTAKTLMFRAVRRLRRDLASLAPENRTGSVRA